MRLRMRSWKAAAIAVGVLAAGLPLAAAPPAAAAGSTATADTVYYWNGVLLDAFRRQTGAGGAPGPLSRAGAMMNAGIFDVLASADWSRKSGVGGGYRPYKYATSEGGDFNDDLGAGIAARDLLIAALPAQQTFVQQKYTERYGATADSSASFVANAVVSAITSARAGDGASSTATYAPDGVPGAWRPTANRCTAAVTPQYGLVRPFAMASGSAYRQPLPGGYTTYASLLSSTLYATNLNEVKSLGKSNSTTRTADQTQAAFFWANDLDGTYKPPGHLLAITRTITTGRLTNPLLLASIFRHAVVDHGFRGWVDAEGDGGMRV